MAAVMRTMMQQPTIFTPDMLFGQAFETHQFTAPLSASKFERNATQDTFMPWSVMSTSASEEDDSESVTSSSKSTSPIEELSKQVESWFVSDRLCFDPAALTPGVPARVEFSSSKGCLMAPTPAFHVNPSYILLDDCNAAVGPAAVGPLTRRAAHPATQKVPVPPQPQRGNGKDAKVTTGNVEGREELRQQFKKTVFCHFNKIGRCTKGSQCSFAHSEVEVRSRPNLTKTSICFQWARNGCRLPADQCRYAHGQADLNA